MIGSGNAVIKPLNQFRKDNKRPQSAGIPTGSLANGGFRDLNPYIENIIDTALKEILWILFKYPEIDEIFYSADKTKKVCGYPLLGTSTFNVNEKVLKVITLAIYELNK